MVSLERIEQQKVDQLSKINRNLEALTKAVRALGNRQSIVNVFAEQDPENPISTHPAPPSNTQ